MHSCAAVYIGLLAKLSLVFELFVYVGTCVGAVARTDGNKLK